MSNNTSFKKGQTPWNKGLTTVTDDRVANYYKKGEETRIRKYGSAFPNNNMSEEHKRKIGNALKGRIAIKKAGHIDKLVLPQDLSYYLNDGWVRGRTVNPDRGKHISENKLGKPRTGDVWNKGKKLGPVDKDKLKIKLSKEYLTKKANNSFNTSTTEINFYSYLLKENVNKTIYRNYKDDDRYPFYCDFYIKEDDLFIELNAHWTHGGKPFNPSDVECIEQLSIWKEKAKTSNFYKNAIETWTVRDVKKLEVAQRNNLNYKVIY